MRKAADERTRLRQRRIAQLAVGPSTLRGQGPGGMVSVARAFLADFDLRSLTRGGERGFRRQLDRATLALRNRFPCGGRHWGAARKVINIFLRDALYDSCLSQRFALDHVEPWLELPLDRHVAVSLRAEPEARILRPWRTIKALDPATSECFQQTARLVASRRGVAPVHLDLWYWRRDGSA
jgi:hypothetical protein